MTKTMSFYKIFKKEKIPFICPLLSKQKKENTIL